MNNEERKNPPNHPSFIKKREAKQYNFFLTFSLLIDFAASELQENKVSKL